MLIDNRYTLLSCWMKNFKAFSLDINKMEYANKCGHMTLLYLKYLCFDKLNESNWQNLSLEKFSKSSISIKRWSLISLGIMSVSSSSSRFSLDSSCLRSSKDYSSQEQDQCKISTYIKDSCVLLLLLLL